MSSKKRDYKERVEPVGVRVRVDCRVPGLLMANNLKSFLGGSSAAEASGMAIVVGTSGASQLQDKSSRETTADKTGTVECEYILSVLGGLGYIAFNVDCLIMILATSLLGDYK